MIFDKKFKKIYKEITSLSEKIDEKKGYLFFKSHVYSQDELLNSKHHDKIESISEKIGDDANNWAKNGELDETDRINYSDNKVKTERKLEDVNDLIEERKPTWWDGVKTQFAEFIKTIINEKLRELAGWLLKSETTKTMLSHIPIIGTILSIGLSFFIKNNDKQLSKPKEEK